MRVLLAWELGSGLGHARALAELAIALRHRGHAVALALADPTAVPREARNLELRSGPASRPGTRSDIASYPEILAAHGWDRADVVAADLAIWEGLLTDIDLVVANHAPGALLAARVRGLARIAIGTGFSCPPAIAPMPGFRHWDPVLPARLEACERGVLAAVNEALSRRHASAVATLSEALAELPVALWTERELDPYGPRNAVLAVGALGEGVAGERRVLPAVNSGTRIFAYLKWRHPATMPLLQALRARADTSTLAFVPDAPAHAIAALVSPTLQMHVEAVPLAQALAWCEVAICHAGATTTNAALAAGRPLLLLPEVPEQFLTALAVHALGAGHWWVPPSPGEEAPAWPVLIEHWLGDATMRGAARAFGESVGGYQPERARARLCDAIEGAL